MILMWVYIFSDLSSEDCVVSSFEHDVTRVEKGEIEIDRDRDRDRDKDRDIQREVTTLACFGCQC